MKLYYAPGACSLSPHIVAREAGIAVQLQKVNTKDKSMEGGGDFWQVNPRGYVPVLELDNGERLTEGPAFHRHTLERQALLHFPEQSAQSARKEEILHQPIAGREQIRAYRGHPGDFGKIVEP